MPIPCVILHCPSALLPIYHTFPLASSSSLILSCIPASLTHPRVCWNINIPPMPSAPHPTRLPAPCQGAPVLTAGLQEPKPPASHGCVNSAAQKSRSFGERFQPCCGKQRHRVKAHRCLELKISSAGAVCSALTRSPFSQGCADRLQKQWLKAQYESK